MSDLGELLGTLLSSMVHARRIADEETAAVAEYYREHPLLEGLTVPRVGVPELTIELPVLVEKCETGQIGELQDLTVIKAALAKRLMATASSEGIDLPRATRARFERQLDVAFREAGLEREGPREGSLEDVARAVERAFSITLESEPVARIEGPAVSRITRDLLAEAVLIAPKKPRIPPKLGVSVITGEVKEKSDPGTVVRMRIVLREEGLEWTATTDADGTTRRFLTPE